MVWSRNSSEGFLSTPSARRATGDPRCELPKVRNFYPRPPRGGRRAVSRMPSPYRRISIHALREEGDGVRPEVCGCHRISIHALREEGDRPAPASTYTPGRFLSTPSARRATRRSGGDVLLSEISIHALREEGDCCRTRQCCRPANFYPRPPRGGRPLALLRAAMPCGFLSTPSARRATNPCTDSGHIHQFLSTPSARRATVRATTRAANGRQFLSTPSARRATRWTAGTTVTTTRFLSTPSARRATRAGECTRSLLLNFYPRPPRGGRPDKQYAEQLADKISIHALREEGDLMVMRVPPRYSDFYPRPPRGGRQQKQRQNLYFLINYTTFCTNLEEP